MWLLQHIQQGRHDVRDGIVRGRPKPVSLKVRKRALTLPLPPSRQKQKISAQSGSILFIKLPVEIRLQIWQRSLGGRVVELTMFNRHLRQLESRWLPEGRNTHILLPLLLVCRKMY